jgi:hypothetical protein
MRRRAGSVSEANSCTVGIEVVSWAGSRAAPVGYVNYTDEQYEALTEWIWEMYRRYGPLPVVTHGQLQLDRTDPVGLDLARVGLVWAGDGYRLAVPVGDEPSPPSGELPMDTTEHERASYKAYFEQLGTGVNMETAIMKRAALAYKRDEGRGPALSGEYEYSIGHIRQDFTAGSLDYNVATGEVNWAELNLEK